MSAANDLVERLEKETGQRLDAGDGENLVMAGLFGAMSRMLGQSPASYREQDDVVAGVVIRHRMSQEYKQEQAAREVLASALVAGMSPGDAKDLLGNE